METKKLKRKSKVLAPENQSNEMVVEESKEKIKTNLLLPETVEKKPRINIEEIFKYINAEEYCIDVKRELEKSTEIVKKKLKLDEKLLRNAISILKSDVDIKYEKNTNLFLRKEDEFLYLNFVFSKLPNSYSLRPVPIAIPSSIYGESFASKVCIIVADPKSDFKELDLKFPFICKVISIENLKLKFERFIDRRDLVRSYDLFVCDSKIYKLLKRFLGKPFYTAKKFPIPVNMDYTDKETLQKSITSLVNKKTIFYLNSGPNYTVKFARSVMDDDSILRNAAATAKRVLPHILKWGIDFKE